MKPDRLGLVRGALLVYLVFSLGFVGLNAGADLLDALEFPYDFRIFYRAADVVTSAHPQHLYDPAAWRASGEPISIAPGHFFNPPTLAYLYVPLAQLPLTTAQFIHLGLLVVALVAVGLLIERWCRSSRETLLVWLAMLSYWPLYFSFSLGHPSIAYGLAMLGALMLLESKRSTLAAVLVGVLALKPSLALGFVASLWARRYWTPAIVATILSLTIVLLPFAVLGGNALDDYISLARAVSRTGFQADTELGATYMFNWNGFWANLLSKDPPLLLLIPSCTLTLLLAAKVIVRGSLRESWFAAGALGLLLQAHVFPYDWTILLPLGAALALENRNPVTIAMLGLVHFTANFSMFQYPQLIGSGGAPAIDLGGYVAVPMLTLTLAYLAFRRPVDSILARSLGFDASVAAAASSAST